MSQFEKGDRVVYLGGPYSVGNTTLVRGDILSYSSSLSDGSHACTNEYMNSFFGNRAGLKFAKDEIELEHLYNSPLMKALR